MRPKSEIDTPKRDEEHPSPFYMGVCPPNLFDRLRWKSLVSQRQIERAAMVFKSLHGFWLLFERLCE